jgi:hypothetical protein
MCLAVFSYPYIGAFSFMSFARMPGVPDRVLFALAMLLWLRLCLVATSPEGDVLNWRGDRGPEVVVILSHSLLLPGLPTLLGSSVAEPSRHGMSVLNSTRQSGLADQLTSPLLVSERLRVNVFLIFWLAVSSNHG